MSPWPLFALAAFCCLFLQWNNSVGSADDDDDEEMEMETSQGVPDATAAAQAVASIRHEDVIIGKQDIDRLITRGSQLMVRVYEDLNLEIFFYDFIL